MQSTSPRRGARIELIASLIGICVAGAGCGGSNAGRQGPATIAPSSFSQRPSEGVDQRRGELQDQPGNLKYDNPRGDQPRSDAQQRNADAQNDPRQQPLTISDAVRDNVRGGAEAATQRAGPSPSAGSPAEGSAGSAPSTTGLGKAGSSFEYMTLGAVLTEVNGQPIYADRILADLTPLLSARAKDLGQTQFRTMANDEIKKQVQFAIRSELEFAAADRNLEQKDKDLARALTTSWRQQQITAAGGSIELAKQRARAEGQDFEKLAEERYRLELRRIYFQRKEFPKIQVTANDLRAYYDAHKKELYTQQDQAQFRVIRIDSSKVGSREAALKRASEIRDRAMGGEDFADIAGTTNDDPLLLKNHGDVGNGTMVDRGAFRDKPIEDAVWALHPGEITDVITIGNNFYVAKLEQKKMGRVVPFEERGVQDKIRETLQSSQFRDLHDEHVKKMLADSIIYPDPPNITPALEMAMQRYVAWAGK